MTRLTGRRREQHDRAERHARRSAGDGARRHRATGRSTGCAAGRASSAASARPRSSSSRSALLLYFGLTNSTTFVSRTNAIDLLSEIAAPIIDHRHRRGAAADLRRDRPVGRLHLHVRAVHHVLPDRLLRRPGAPGDHPQPRLRRCAAAGSTASSPSRCGLPSFITTLGTGFILAGLALYTLARRAEADPARHRRLRRLDRDQTRGRSSSGPSSSSRSSTSCYQDQRGGCTRSRPAATCSGRARPASTWAGSSTATS